MFTLVFTITIFAVQMTKMYTSIDKVFDMWTLLFMILFGIGIILPLIQLVVSHNYLPFDKIENLSLAIDLFLASFCILSIIPYSIRINKIMKYESGILNLSNDISEAIDLDHKAVASIKISELTDLGKISIDEMQWDKTCSIVDKLRDIAGKISDETFDEKWIDLNLSIIRWLIEVSSKNQLKNKKFTIRVIKALGTIGSKEEILLLDKKQEELKLKSSNLLRVRDSFIISNYHYLVSKHDISLLYIIPESKMFFSFIFGIKKHMDKAEFQAEFPIEIQSFGQRSKYLKNIYEDVKKRNNLILPEVPESQNFLSLPRRTVMGLHEIGFKLSFESRHHSKEIAEIVRELKNIGVSAINLNLKDSIASMSSYCIYEIIALSVQNGKNDPKTVLLVVNAMRHLEEIANKAYKKDKNQFEDSYKSSLEFWWILGAYSNIYLPNYTKEIVSKLKKSNNQIIKENIRNESILHDVREYLTSYQGFIENLDDFEELYNNLEEQKAL